MIITAMEITGPAPPEYMKIHGETRPTQLCTPRIDLMHQEGHSTKQIVL